MRVEEMLNVKLPRQFDRDRRLAATVLGAFEIRVEGAGTWTLTMDGRGRIRPGRGRRGTYQIRGGREDFEALLDNPDAAWSLVTAGKIQVSNLEQAARLMDAVFPGALERGMGDLHRSVFPRSPAARPSGS